MIKGKNSVFAANSIYLAFGLFVAVFLLGNVLYGMVTNQSGVAKAASSENSLSGLERNIERFDVEDTFSINFPLEIGKDICFVGFSKGETEIDRATKPDIIRPSDCNSFVEYSCLCMFRGKDCEIWVRCSDFKQFNVIEILDPSNSFEGIPGQNKGIKGDGKIKNIEVIKTSKRNLIIRAG